jgi:hypothetical protein
MNAKIPYHPDNFLTGLQASPHYNKGCPELRLFGLMG